MLICKADTSGRFQWALANGGDAWTSVGPIACDRAGNIYVGGDLHFIMTPNDCFCDTGMLGSFPLTLQFEGTSDAFVARLTDPTTVVAELKIARTASGLALSWPAALSGFVLESTDALPPLTWTVVTTAPVLDGDQNAVSIEIGSSPKFFRLSKP